mmetsp:Transcript_2905/g.6688  ORF Transcript_2905/g.6688 Transcript_2905/m.6688 type:complete len:214 (-) Transcript_2905:588-1229(-)
MRCRAPSGAGSLAVRGGVRQDHPAEGSRVEEHVDGLRPLLEAALHYRLHGLHFAPPDHHAKAQQRLPRVRLVVVHEEALKLELAGRHAMILPPASDLACGKVVDLRGAADTEDLPTDLHVLAAGIQLGPADVVEEDVDALGRELPQPLVQVLRLIRDGRVAAVLEQPVGLFPRAGDADDFAALVLVQLAGDNANSSGCRCHKDCLLPPPPHQA